MAAADVMTGDATYDRTFDAAFGVSSRCRNGQRERDGHAYQDLRHRLLPSLSEVERKTGSRRSTWGVYKDEFAPQHRL